MGEPSKKARLLEYIAGLPLTTKQATGLCALIAQLRMEDGNDTELLRATDITMHLSGDRVHSNAASGPPPGDATSGDGENE